MAERIDILAKGVTHRGTRVVLSDSGFWMPDPAVQSDAPTEEQTQAVEILNLYMETKRLIMQSKLGYSPDPLYDLAHGLWDDGAILEFEWVAPEPKTPVKGLIY